MEMPEYTGIIESWKVKLIIARAKYAGFKDDDLPDVLQELVLELLTFEYDTNNANGADERTVLQRVIDNHLYKIVRGNCRYQLHLQRILSHQVDIFSNDDNINHSQRIDIKEAIETLSPRQQQICYGLAMGLSKEQLARQLNCSWHTINKSCNDIRRQFEKMGIDGRIK